MNDEYEIPLDDPDVMPFGKYKGQRIDDLPSGYIRWVLDNLTDLDCELSDALQETWDKRTTSRYNEGPRYQYRKERYAPPDDFEISEKDSQKWELKIIQAGYRALATQLHPDTGGSEEDMKCLNVTMDKLKRRYGK